MLYESLKKKKNTREMSSHFANFRLSAGVFLSVWKIQIFFQNSIVIPRIIPENFKTDRAVIPAIISPSEICSFLDFFDNCYNITCFDP
jgi:hypothetical protein